jgi:hypothetical protein
MSPATSSLHCLAFSQRALGSAMDKITTTTSKITSKIKGSAITIQRIAPRPDSRNITLGSQVSWAASGTIPYFSDVGGS